VSILLSIFSKGAFNVADMDVLSKFIFRVLKTDNRNVTENTHKIKMVVLDIPTMY
jgi:hypothetical protein